METKRSEVQRKPVRLIAAACNEMGIGKNGTLPWHLPSEFQYFLDTVSRVSTPGKMNMMVWGKVCWFSQPDSVFPVSNVKHVVLSTTLSSVPERAHFLVEDFECAVRLASRTDTIETIWVVGGSQVYKDALDHPWCDLVYLTNVMANFDCDVFFPEFDRGLFQIQERFPEVPTDIQEENGIKYKFQVFKKSISNAI